MNSDVPGTLEAGHVFNLLVKSRQGVFKKSDEVDVLIGHGGASRMVFLPIKGYGTCNINRTGHCVNRHLSLRPWNGFPAA